MPHFPDKYFDAILTDPPYGVDYQSNFKKDKSQWFPKIANDDKPFVEWIPLAKRILKDSGAIYTFYRWDVQEDFLSQLRSHFTVKSQIVWDKIVHGMGDLKSEYGPQHENILFAVMPKFQFHNGRPRSVITQKRVNPEELVHPNQKPVPLMEKLILDSTPKGGIVLDPFMGSGTTGVACIRTGRRFVGIEIDPKYYHLAKQNLSQALCQPSLF